MDNNIYIKMNILLVVLWYLYLSATDWSIHKYILHSDTETEIRQQHRIHHLAHLGKISTDIGLSFNINEALSITLISVLPVIVLAWKLGYKIVNAILIHTALVLIGTGVHNYAHYMCHTGSNGQCIPWIRDCGEGYILQLPVPGFICDILNNHHLQHHTQPRTNYCTAYLGFDYIAGTAGALCR